MLRGHRASHGWGQPDGPHHQLQEEGQHLPHQGGGGGAQVGHRQDLGGGGGGGGGRGRLLTKSFSKNNVYFNWKSLNFLY